MNPAKRKKLARAAVAKENANVSKALEAPKQDLGLKEMPVVQKPKVEVPPPAPTPVIELQKEELPLVETLDVKVEDSSLSGDVLSQAVVVDVPVTDTKKKKKS